MATEELLTCPEIYQYARAHTIILAPNNTRTVSVVTPLTQPLGDLTDAHVHYDSNMVDVSMAHIMHEDNLLYITLTLRGLDVGVTELSVRLPEVAAISLATTSVTD